MWSSPQKKKKKMYSVCRMNRAKLYKVAKYPNYMAYGKVEMKLTNHACVALM